jgi:hypothetical protein
MFSPDLQVAFSNPYVVNKSDTTFLTTFGWFWAYYQFYGLEPPTATHKKKKMPFLWL